MPRRHTVVLFAALLSYSAVTFSGQAWIARSNLYTQRLLDVQLAHAPEEGSQEGVSKYDALISDPSRADEVAKRSEFVAVLAALKAERGKETDENVQEDLDILLMAFDLQFRREDYELAHEVPFINASEIVFQGLRGLLDDQVSADRRLAAVLRLKKYAGLEPGAVSACGCGCGDAPRSRGRDDRSAARGFGRSRSAAWKREADDSVAGGHTFELCAGDRDAGYAG